MSRPSGLAAAPVHETKQRLLEAGMRLMLARGYNAVGVQDILGETGVPKGSFYHHFDSKEAFVLDIIDTYQSGVYALLHDTLTNRRRAPLRRVRDFFEGVQASYETEGYLGCLLGALGQELSGANEVFRQRIAGCLGSIAEHLATCFREAQAKGDLPAHLDALAMANLLVNAWEGAALRSRLHKSPAPLGAMLDFYFGALPTG